MTDRPGGRFANTPQPFRVSTAMVCNTCGQDIDPAARIVKRRDSWIHRTCAPGADDE